VGCYVVCCALLWGKMEGGGGRGGRGNVYGSYGQAVGPIAVAARVVEVLVREGDGDGEEDESDGGEEGGEGAGEGFEPPVGV